MKKLLALLSAAVMLFTFASCGNKKDATDAEYVKEKGKLVVGITDFAPMDYQEGEEWIGFDADMAKLFAEKLGVEAEFVVIEWDNKVFELDSKNIDCIWNGMTLDDGVKAAMSTSDPYCNNQQIVIVNKDVADKYQTEEACKDLKFAVEAGSAAAKLCKEKGFACTEVLDQATALLEVKSKTSDAAIVDSLMAAAMVGEGTSYEELTYTVGLTDEVYGVGFRKDSDLTEKLNDFFKETKESGKMMEIAEKYKVQAAIIK